MTGHSSAGDLQAPSSVRVNSWWSAEFPGEPAQAGEAQRWVRDLLPAAEQRDIVVQTVGELAANAIRHTRSGQPGGLFTVEIGWWAHGMIWVVVGDQGSTGHAPRFTEKRSGSARHGLSRVRRMAAALEAVGGADGRWLCADIPWPKDTPPAGDAGVHGEEALNMAIARRFPGAQAWWGYSTRRWWAMPGPSVRPAALVEAPTPYLISLQLAAQYSAVPPTRPPRPVTTGTAPSAPRPAFRPPQPGGSAA